jgi:cytochrome c oxidase subunit 3
VALGRTIAKAFSDLALPRLRSSVELCAIYWHFLLVIWLILFGLLSGSADDFLKICRQVLG